MRARLGAQGYGFLFARAEAASDAPRESGQVAEVRDGPRLLVVRCGPHEFRTDEVLRWFERDCPPCPPMRQGFVAVLRDDRDGSVIAASGRRMEVSLYYACPDPETLVVGANLRDVVRALPEHPPLETSVLADLLLLWDAPEHAPFAGIHRLPLGHRLDWAPGEPPRIRPWFDPDALDIDSPARGEEAAHMRETVIDAVDASLPDRGDVCSMLSGGLDSSMVVASAAQLLDTSGRVVHTVTHVPVMGTVDERPGWEADDGPLARRMTSSLPDATWRPISNAALRSPLDALRDCYERSYSPSNASANMIWILAMQDWADSMRSEVLLTGAAGNAPFSRGPEGVLRELVHRRRFGALTRQINARRMQGASLLRSLAGVAREIAPDPLLRLLGRADPAPDVAALMPLRLDATSERAREQHVRGLAHVRLTDAEWREWVLQDAATATLPQSTSTRAWWSDPLSDPYVLALALRLDPEAWIEDGRPRSLARRAAEGLVPDDIRLRTTRGAQSSDIGAALAVAEPQYRDALDRMRASAAASEFLDLDRMQASLDAGVPTQGVAAMIWDATYGRAFNLGEFAAWYEHDAA